MCKLLLGWELRRQRRVASAMLVSLITHCGDETAHGGFIIVLALSLEVGKPCAAGFMSRRALRRAFISSSD